MELLREYYALDYNKGLITEAIDGQPQKVFLTGIIQKADTLNQNGRVYPKELLEREIRAYEKLIEEGRSLGECDHPSESEISLKSVSHIIRKIWWEGDNVMGKIEILDTMYGKELKTLINAGVKLGISSRGVGNTQNRGNAEYVLDDYQLICFDIVSDPSTPGAFLKKESRQLISGNLDNTFNQSDKIYKDYLNLMNVIKK